MSRVSEKMEAVDHNNSKSKTEQSKMNLRRHFPAQSLTTEANLINTMSAALDLPTRRRSLRSRKPPVDILSTPTSQPKRSARWSLIVELRLSPENLRAVATNTQLPIPLSRKRKSETLDSDSDSSGSPNIQRRQTEISPQEVQKSQLQHGKLAQPQPHVKTLQDSSMDLQVTPYISPLIRRETPTPPSSPLSLPITKSSSIPSADLLQLADQIHDFHTAAVHTSKSMMPEPSQQPQVWADKRMELCETLHYYRSYHGGCYSTGGFAQSFMLANGAHKRDYMDASVIISRAGGGLTANVDTGIREMAGDQAETSVVRSVRNNMVHYNPVVIIVEEKNPMMPSQTPHPYCVLDYFKPTHIWWEKTQSKKFIRYRFEKLNSKGASWWQPKGTMEIAPPGSLEPPVCLTCPVCEIESQQVYIQGWMCLQPECDRFWKLELAFGQLQEPIEDALVYDPRFLKQKTAWPIDDCVYPLGSINAELSGRSIPGEDCSQAHWLGFTCPLCGRCNSRLEWTGWRCFGPDCTWKKQPPHTLIPAAALHDPFNPTNAVYMPSRDSFTKGVKMTVSFAHNYRINQFEIPGIDGFVVHMIANKTVNEEAGGPNDMYEEIQSTDIGLIRRNMGQDYFTRHYTVNYGMPYKFIAATDSYPFTGSARPVTATRSRLNWAAKYLLSTNDLTKNKTSLEEWNEFNEVLALGYYENQKISYHDDGETGLGPTIATLSLGDTGTMRIRMKAKHFNGVSKAGVYNTSRPLPGSSFYEKRLAIADELEELHDIGNGGRAAYTKRLKQLPKELGLKTSGNAKDAISMTVAHGDIVLMHGAEIQNFYEHAVDHSGKLRFALTCRYIDPKSLKDEDKPQYEVEPDEGGYDGAKLPVPGC